MIRGPDGQKMSKTLGNVISPFDQLKKFGHEAIRFYMINNIPTFGNAAYKEDDLVNTYNSCLADCFGNLLNRVIHLSIKKEATINDEETVSQEIKTQVEILNQQINNAYDNFELQEASNLIHNLAMFGNKYMDENQPRDKTKSPKEVAIILNNLSYIIKHVAQNYLPIIPLSAQKALDALAKQEKKILFEKLTLELN